MASSSNVKAPCATCGSKATGIFKCEGCGQVFCRKHVIEHRDVLSQQLDEIVFEYDSLQQTMTEAKENLNRKQNNPLINQIDKWEEDSIEKIRQMAKEARNEVTKLSNSSPGRKREENSVLYACLIHSRNGIQRLARTSTTIASSSRR